MRKEMVPWWIGIENGRPTLCKEGRKNRRRKGILMVFTNQSNVISFDSLLNALEKTCAHLWSVEWRLKSEGLKRKRR